MNTAHKKMLALIVSHAMVAVVIGGTVVLSVRISGWRATAIGYGISLGVGVWVGVAVWLSILARRQQ